MKIAVLCGPRDFQINEQPIPEIQPDEVLLRVAACGVCTS
jgi:L-iditol 2-dehydrogenase